jgi:hypothetical protein
MPRFNRAPLNGPPLAEATYLNNQKATMSHWQHTTMERPETDGPVYAMDWTISGLAVLGTGSLVCLPPAKAALPEMMWQ